VRQLLDIGSGLLLCGIVHYVLDEEKPAEIVASLARALPPGSYVFIHHLLDTGALPPRDCKRSCSRASERRGFAPWRRCGRCSAAWN
jgi:S-adenosyl methyltransferase